MAHAVHESFLCNSVIQCPDELCAGILIMPLWTLKQLYGDLNSTGGGRTHTLGTQTYKNRGWTSSLSCILIHCDTSVEGRCAIKMSARQKTSTIHWDAPPKISSMCSIYIACHQPQSSHGTLVPRRTHTYTLQYRETDPKDP